MMCTVSFVGPAAKMSLTKHVMQVNFKCCAARITDHILLM